MALCYPILPLYIGRCFRDEVPKFINALPPTVETLRIDGSYLTTMSCLYSALGLSQSDVSSPTTLDRILYQHGPPNVMEPFWELNKKEPRFCGPLDAAKEETRTWLDVRAGIKITGSLPMKT